MLDISVILLSLPALLLAQVIGPLTPHFQDWLERQPKRNSYLLDVIANYGSTGSYGGRYDETDEINYHPIVFIHGNSDSALNTGAGDWATGWNGQIEAFLDHGYSTAELYAITYGDRNISNSFTRQFNCRDLLGHRRFLEAVLEYTNAGQIKVVGHSMGVSIARKIIKGGKTLTPDGICDLGPSLAPKISTLMGLAGANYGMCICELYSAFNACGVVGGFYPGTCPKAVNEVVTEENQCSTATSPPCGEVSYGSVLQSVNVDNGREADNVISMWSDDDEIIGKNNLVWGKKTSLIPGSTIQKVYNTLKHSQVKTDTIRDQLHFLTRHYF